MVSQNGIEYVLCIRIGPNPDQLLFSGQDDNLMKKAPDVSPKTPRAKGVFIQLALSKVFLRQTVLYHP